MTKGPLPDLLTSIAGDACALSKLKLAVSSHDEDMQVLAPALKNLYRRLARPALPSHLRTSR